MYSIKELLLKMFVWMGSYVENELVNWVTKMFALVIENNKVAKVDICAAY